jgi:hypothetical protein
MHGPVLPTGPASAARPQDAGPVGVRADLATAAGHDHCANAALLRWRDVALTAPATFAPLTPAPHSLTFAGSRDGAHGALVYLLAPKTSPPRAGA